MKHLIHTPEGVRDIFGAECDKKRYLERRIEKLFRSYGYQSIETPTFEFIDVFRTEIGTAPSNELYKFFDRAGNTLVLRPDFTPSIARAAAMYFQDENMPLRFCYRGSVFNNSVRYRGQLKESTQMGVELLNEDNAETDAEIIALMVSVMKRAGLHEYQISVGEAGYFNALVEEAQMSREDSEELRQLLMIRNRFGAEELIERLSLSGKVKDALLALPDLFGEEDVLERAAEITDNPKARAAVERMKRMYKILGEYECRDSISFDFSMVSAYGYYTGIIAQGYTYGTGDAVIKGGRYDRMLESFGKKAPAVGFVTEIDALLNAIERQGIRLPVDDIKTMILYSPGQGSKAIRLTHLLRSGGNDVACIGFREDKTPQDYVNYGKRNQFARILWFRTGQEVCEIDMKTGAVSQTDANRYLD